ncbi:MAG: glutamate decarboxylase [Bacteroidetes bacterium]|nr:MAG: glutamate decarboxylase [Bacteroidota bacterium]
MTRKEILGKTFELINDYQSSVASGEKSVINYHQPHQLKDKIDLKLPSKAGNYDNLFSDIEKYLKHSVHTSHKQFLNQLYSGENLPALIGEFITALTNTSMYTYEVAPLATLIEKELINKMCRIAGFTDGGGTFTTGGSNANMLAMMSARNKLLPDIKKNGLMGAQTLAVFVSDQSHYSFDTAANILGIGSDHVYKIKSDSHGRMLIEDLVKAIETSLIKSETPFFIAATAGTTLLGAFDPLDEIAEIAQNYKIWMHVDGSFGGSIILSTKYKYLFNGIERADSFTWNPHKLMNVPLIASVLLVKEKDRLLKNLTDLDTDYIYHDNDVQEYNLGKQSIQCGRRVDALKVWLAWRFYGDEGYAQRINRMFELANYARKKVDLYNQLQLLAEPQSLTICFTYKSDFEKENDKLNLEIRETLMKKGLSLVNYGYLKEKVAIRLVISNPDIEEKDLDEFFENFVQMGSVLENEKSIVQQVVQAEKCLIIE